MRISRELLVNELTEIVSNIEVWIKELENPKYSNLKKDGTIEESFVYEQCENGTPLMSPFISVCDIEDLNVQQLRAELIFLAHKLEALATS